MKPEIQIRLGTPEDLSFLREMLFEAAYWRPGQERPDLETGLQRPDLAYLLADWGRTGDTAVIAIARGSQRVGAAWYRFWGPEQHSYGYVSPQIPELAIAVSSVWRGQGIGHQLIKSILSAAAAQGVDRISLSVEVDNSALKLYRQHGFKPLVQNPGDWVMLADTKPEIRSL